MNRPERTYEFAVMAAVAAVFATLALVIVAANDPPEFQSQYVQLAIAWLLFTTPWVIAARLLWRAWWRRHSPILSALDWPARLLAAAVATLPDERRDWGAAMQAELDQVRGCSSRWWFAAGCARTALFPPPSSRAPVLAIAALAASAVVVAQFAVGLVLPAMRVFAVAFVALVGGMATLAAARSRPLRQIAPGPTIALAGVVGVTACIAMTVYFLVMHPAAAANLSPTNALVFAAALAGCLSLALLPPRGLNTDRIARGVGVAGALAFGLGYFVTSRLTVDTYAGPLIWTLLAPPAAFFATSAVAAALGRSFRTGAQAAVWTALVATLLVFAIAMPEAMRRYAIDGRTLADGEAGYPIGVNLADAIWALLIIPAWGLPFGVIGAAVGNWRSKRRSGERLGQHPS